MGVGIMLLFEKDQTSGSVTFTDVAVHDPSIIKVDDVYYIFGSHIEAAKSVDLMNWETFTNGYTTLNNVLYDDLIKNLAPSFLWAGHNDSDCRGGFAVWAPEIFWNAHYVNHDGSKGAFMIYYSVSSTYIRSAIGFAVSKVIEGPYSYVDTIVYSGFTEAEAYDQYSEVNKQWTYTHLSSLIATGALEDVNAEWFRGGAYHNAIYPNAIDANVFYDEQGKLWMSYGSWSGGIFLLKLDEETGRPVYPGIDSTTTDGRLVDRYFGTKIAGGHGQSGEGPYIIYDEKSGYYYLYVTYGWLGADGGYNIRVFRSEAPDGPYLDIKQVSAVLAFGDPNYTRGNKLLGNFMFMGEADSTVIRAGLGYVSPGHNSVLYDEAIKKQFLVFHTRFPYTNEMHQVRVHQLYLNEDHWPVVTPYRYGGESLRKVRNREIVGKYQFINHGSSISASIVESLNIKLTQTGTITGDIEGTWQKTGDYFAEIVINDITYKGVFVEAWSESMNQFVMTFTAVSNRGISIWGSMYSK